MENRKEKVIDLIHEYVDATEGGGYLTYSDELYKRLDTLMARSGVLSTKQQICKNCKYWKESNSYPIKNTKIGKCKKAKMFWDSTEWTDEENNDWIAIRTLKEENKTDKAFVQDGSDYMASLLTLEEFGCNQFSE